MAVVEAVDFLVVLLTLLVAVLEDLAAGLAVFFETVLVTVLLVLLVLAGALWAAVLGLAVAALTCETGARTSANPTARAVTSVFHEFMRSSPNSPGDIQAATTRLTNDWSLLSGDEDYTLSETFFKVHERFYRNIQ